MKTLIGIISVDAGIVWIGDPCYILHKEKDEIPEDIGYSWSGFCNKLNEKSIGKPYWQFNHSKNNSGLGVCVSSGYGDGTYPVYASINKEGIVEKVWVEFISSREDFDE